MKFLLLFQEIQTLISKPNPKMTSRNKGRYLLWQRVPSATQSREFPTQLLQVLKQPLPFIVW